MVFLGRIRPADADLDAVNGRNGQNGRYPAIALGAVPFVSAAQMAEVDRLAVEEYGIGLLQMMEQAGSHLADVAITELGGDARGRRIVIAAGPGDNGGGGLVAARHLVNRGASVRVILARPAGRLGRAGRHQLETLLAMNVSCCVATWDIAASALRDEVARADLVIDALLGYRAKGAPRDEVASLLEGILPAAARTLSLDLPSGMDPDTGTMAALALSAMATMTLALPKAGLASDSGRARAGRLYLADLGLPEALYARLGLRHGTPFAEGRVVRLEA